MLVLAILEVVGVWGIVVLEREGVVGTVVMTVQGRFDRSLQPSDCDSKLNVEVCLLPHAFNKS